MDNPNKAQLDWYMRVYQITADVLMATIPEDDTNLPSSAQKQLKDANDHAVKVMNALANIITLLDNSDADESDLP